MIEHCQQIQLAERKLVHYFLNEQNEKKTIHCFNNITAYAEIFKTRRPRTSGIFSAPNLFEKDY